MKTFAEFAKLAGVSRQAIYLAVNKGMLPSVGNRIDETCADARAYISLGGKKKSAPVVAPTPKKQKKQPVEKIEEPEPMPIPERRQPKQPSQSGEEFSGFKSKAELEIKRLEQQIESLKLRNQETVGNLIPREKVERLIFQPISVAHQRMLSDGAKAIAAYLHPYIAGGATVQECETYIRKQLSGFIKAAKRDMKKVIADDPN